MKSQLYFTTKNKNKYLFDFNKNTCILIHPWQEFIKEGIILKKFETKNQKAMDHYLKRYLFLKQHGWYKDFNFKKNIAKEIYPDDIKRKLANTEQLTLEVTEMCNLNCYYCGYGKFYTNHKRRRRLNLSLVKAKLIIDCLLDLWNSDLNESKNKTIYLGFYGGEPLLNFELIQNVVAYVNQSKGRHNIIRFAMTTNAILLDRYMKFMVDNNFKLLISIDGNKYNNSYRVNKNNKESFENVIRNIDKLKRQYPLFFRDNVNFNSVLHNRNSVEEIFDFFIKRFNKKPKISELNASGINQKEQKEFYNIFQNIENSILVSNNPSRLIKNFFIAIPHIKDLSRFIIQCNLENYKSFNDFFIDSQNISHTPTGTCIPFSKKIFITVDGKIFPCETIGDSFYLGKIEEDEVKIDYTQIAKYYNGLYKKIRQQCQSCYYQRSCIQCLFNLFFQHNDTPICQNKMKIAFFQKYLSEKIATIEKHPKLYIKILNEVNIK